MKYEEIKKLYDAEMSSSSRRTWIEILLLYTDLAYFIVVLLAEDVD